MTIQLFCPNCNEIHELEDNQSGKRSRCTNCGQLFIVPSESFKKPKKVEPPKEIPPKDFTMLQPGDVVTIELSGGGGYGNPKKRRRELIEKDTIAGLVTKTM